ncbi:uncharacterized protein CC84DRAFT_1090763 [Paraphaeosphaeria sporulosa]|uniref:rRNA-processing protein EFG1 n=1 Tax=Paraphaeosphaeria sporulosa TaxID=1460663 RepID=A0A177CFK5_9PLEO|nr:uncharacterized protein CC84DRAFT_1090763 [Paraphaeosphaeria sporulosa]OAG06395.1 hypothetical protein CC84DRAFT_1090763 [Paraphaeosphaeria sporulosa]
MSTAHTKRKRSDNADAGDHGRRPKQYKQSSNRPRPNKFQGSRHAHAHSGHPKSGDGEEEEAQRSINALKSRIRDLRRSLAHVDSDPKNRMPQGIRIERERELESARHELEEKETAKREAKFRNDIIGKYHMVRFFERQKATRILKRLHKQLAALEDEPEKAEKMHSIHNAEVDLNYTLYYPLLKAYVSLYPKQQKEDSKSGDAAPPTDGPKGDVNMWKTVEKAMGEQTLEELRESREGVIIPGAPENSKAKNLKKDAKKDTKEKKARSNDADIATENGDEEGSDEDFFV